MKGTMMAGPARWMSFILCSGLLLSLAGAQLAGCYPHSEEDLERLNTPQVEAFFNAPGTRRGNGYNRMPAEFVAERIDGAKVSVDAAVYGFNHRLIVDALVRAHARGVKVRIVGDAAEYARGSYGYGTMEEHRIPMQLGNQFHIMHDKFFVIDDRFVFVGTGNISHSEFERNNNNWLLLNSPPLAELFKAEFLQMFGGRFSAAKRPLNMVNGFQIGDTFVEVFFSPQDDAMGKILEELANVDTSIHFTIFAFTKDQVASRFIEKHRAFDDYNRANGYGDRPPMDRPKRVVGVLDRSQLHGNGQYHQGYRLLANAVPMRMDGNENSAMPGDYQAGGGRLHAKTMILDHGTPNARVVTGSFNWSSAATISNDEVLIVLHGERITDQYMREFYNIWNQGKEVGQSMCNYMINADDLLCGSDVRPGDVVISEIHWDGWNGKRDPSDHTSNFRSDVTNDQFIELYNTADRPINLSMWTLSNGHDVIMGFTPGTVIMPGEYFLVLDHNTVPLSERDPQRGTHAFENPDFVLNIANDPRFRRLNFKQAYMNVILRDTAARVIDRVGDGGPPFYGGRQGDMNFSMERVIPANGAVPDGTLRSSWKQSNGEDGKGGVNVAEDFRDYIIATPGMPNSL